MKTSRRAFFLLLLVVPVLFADGKDKKKPVPPKKDFFAFVGTYTAKRQSKGIYSFRYDAGSGKASGLRLVIESGKTSLVTAFAFDAKTGNLTQLNQTSALGEDPCYITFDKTGKYILIANYTSGALVVFPILPDGRIGEKSALFQDSGTLGPNKERQEGPHAHWVETSADNH